MDTVIETDPAVLPQWKGRPVPWAAKWSGEEIPDRLSATILPDGPRVVYPDGNEDRDSYGYLWRREGISRGGEPQFAQLNAYRQRASMRVPRCHVCGARLPRGKPVRWLLPAGGTFRSADGQAVLTHSPPTCDGCVPLARRLCPALRARGSVLLEVRDFRLWGVIGECFTLRPGTPAPAGLTPVKDLVCEYGRSYRGAGPGNYVARQQVVELVDWTEITAGT